MNAGFRWLVQHDGSPPRFPWRTTSPVNQLIQRKRRIQVLVIQWFQAHITLFSKYFASFPHGTCSLSVSCQYLALEGVYLQFWAALPSNPTHRKRIVNDAQYHVRDCHPLRCAVPSNLSTAHSPWKRFSRLQFAVASNRDFKFELVPLHSPLLRESLLVSFPPLINMLKFSG